MCRLSCKKGVSPPHHKQQHRSRTQLFSLSLSAEKIQDHYDYVLQLLDMHTPTTQQQQLLQERLAAMAGGAGGKAENLEKAGYLVLMNCRSGENLVWRGETIRVKPTAETTITLSQIEVKVSSKDLPN